MAAVLGTKNYDKNYVAYECGSRCKIKMPEIYERYAVGASGYHKYSFDLLYRMDTPSRYRQILLRLHRRKTVLVCGLRRQELELVWK